MALPTTVLAAAGLAGHHPPYKSSGGAFYVVARTDADELDVYKATDPTDTWTEQDSGGNPVHAGTLLGFATFQDGDVIHIIAWDSTVVYEYYTFNMATDAWVVDEQIADATKDPPTFPWASIAVRSDGDVVVVYAGETVGVMGAEKERADYDVRTAGTWSGPQALDAGGDVHYGNPNCVLGTSDAVHVVWQRQTSVLDDPPTNWGDSQGITIDSADSLSTVQNQLFDSNDTMLGLQNAVSYDDAGTQRMIWNMTNGATDAFYQTATEDVSGDLQFGLLGGNPGSDNIYENGEVSICSLSELNGDLHQIYSGGDVFGMEQDLWYSFNDNNGVSADWAESLEIEFLTVNYVSGNIYVRGIDTVLAYLYDESGTQYYNEKILIAGATGPVLTLPTEANITQTSATVGCTTDTTGGTLYWYISTSATPPTAAVLKAGTSAIDFGNVSTPNIGIETFNTTVTLTYNTNYYTYFIHNDGSNDSNLLESGIWATDPADTGAETFGITLDETQQLNKITSEIESFNLILDETNLVNKITDVSQTFDLTLDQLQIFSVLLTEAATFGLTLDQVETIIRITYNAQEFGITLDEVQQLNRITNEIQGFNLILDETNLVNKVTSASQIFDLTLDQLQVISVLLIEAATFGLILDQVEINQADKIESFLAALSLDQQQVNVKTSEGLINFITNLNYQILKQLATNLSITLNTTLDHQFLGSTEAIINAAITFLANVDQIQTNVITADKAATFILEAAEQYGTQLDRLEVFTLAIVASDTYVPSRDLSESISFDTEINQNQTNTLDKVLLMSFNAALDKSITTQGSSFGAIINFASALSYTFNTDGEVSASILYGMDLDQQEQSNKLTDLSMDFSIDTDIITEIHLVVEGQIDFSTIMDKIEAKELLGQKGITFGHIHGLAALNSAVTGESISFGAIQDFEVNGFVASFTILTPNDRILKVYVIDRTSLIDEEIRVIRVNKT